MPRGGRLYRTWCRGDPRPLVDRLSGRERSAHARSVSEALWGGVLQIRDFAPSRPSILAGSRVLLARIREPLGVFVATRVALLIAVWFAQVLLPGRIPTYHGLAPDRPFLTGWAHWDAGWYLGIVTGGYTYDPATHVGAVAFFPLYPLLTRVVGQLIGNNLLAGLLISNVAMAAAMCFLYDLVAGRLGVEVARRTIVLIAVYPFAFYFSALYTESLFLFCAVLAFWFAERDRWWLCGLAGFSCTLTRQMGIVLLPALGLLYLSRRAYDLRRVRPEILGLGLVPLGIGMYMLYLFQKFGEPLAFYYATINAWGHFNLLDSDLSRLDPLGWGVGSFDPILLVNLLAGIVFLGVSFLTYRQLGLAYAAFALLATAIPFGTGLISLGRYLAVVFPVFIVVAAHLRRPLSFNAVVAVSAMFETMLAALYSVNYPII
jgi:hypothetical protein